MTHLQGPLVTSMSILQYYLSDFGIISRTGRKEVKSPPSNPCSWVWQERGLLGGKMYLQMALAQDYDLPARPYLNSPFSQM